MRNKFVYSCSVKIMLQNSTKSLKALSACCCLWKHFPWKMLSRCLQKWSLVGEWWVADEQIFVVQTFKFCNIGCVTCGLSVIFEKNCAHFVDECQLQALKFWGHLIDLLSILLRCNGFTGNQKAIVFQTSSRPPNSDHGLCLVQLWLWEVLWNFCSIQPLSWSLPVFPCSSLFTAVQNLIEKWFVVL